MAGTFLLFFQLRALLHIKVVAVFGGMFGQIGELSYKNNTYLKIGEDILNIFNFLPHFVVF